jgi:hypothetical protein
LGGCGGCDSLPSSIGEGCGGWERGNLGDLGGFRGLCPRAEPRKQRDWGESEGKSRKGVGLVDVKLLGKRISIFT